MDRFRRRPTNGAHPDPPPPSFADGRSWEPLDVADGRPRLVLTLDIVVGDDGVRRAEYHTDAFNVPDEAAAVQLYLDAGPMIAHRARRMMEGKPDA